MKAGFFGCTLLGIVYAGMALLGAYQGADIQASNGAEVFLTISLKVLGIRGALVIATVVVMACFSTIIALAAVLAEYVQKEYTKNQLGYPQCLAGVLTLTSIISCYGLNSIMAFSKPIIFTFYPVVIVITFINIAYKLLDFKPIKTPVLIALLASIYFNFF